MEPHSTCVVFSRRRMQQVRAGTAWGARYPGDQRMEPHSTRDYDTDTEA